MHDYYSEKLAAEKLRRCYELAPPRIKQYLQAELDFISSYLRPTQTVLELGCGYGRVMRTLSHYCAHIVGIDLSHPSLKMASDYLAPLENFLLARMDAGNLAFPDDVFDMVVCPQNGISAIKIDSRRLIHEACRVAKKGGRIFFSSYSDKIWPERLDWFKIQAENKLMGEIDYEKTGQGTIICKDGFVGRTVGPDKFLDLTQGRHREIVEVDNSSMFCLITK